MNRAYILKILLFLAFMNEGDSIGTIASNYLSITQEILQLQIQPNKYTRNNCKCLTIHKPLVRC